MLRVHSKHNFSEGRGQLTHLGRKPVRLLQLRGTSRSRTKSNISRSNLLASLVSIPLVLGGVWLRGLE